MCPFSFRICSDGGSSRSELWVTIFPVLVECIMFKVFIVCASGQPVFELFVLRFASRGPLTRLIPYLHLLWPSASFVLFARRNRGLKYQQAPRPTQQAAISFVLTSRRPQRRHSHKLHMIRKQLGKGLSLSLIAGLFLSFSYFTARTLYKAFPGPC